MKNKNKIDTGLEIYAISLASIHKGITLNFQNNNCIYNLIKFKISFAYNMIFLYSIKNALLSIKVKRKKYEYLK